MTRSENLLFALYALRVSILDRDQFLAICASLRHGKDIDLGQSLTKRGLVDEQQAEALWSLVCAQVSAVGSAKKVLKTFEAGAQIEHAILAAIKPQPAPKGKDDGNLDPPTVNFDPA